MDSDDEPAGIDLARLAPWFAANVTGADPSRPLHATLITGGRSNLTYVIADGVHEWILRRPPLGHVLATAHDMGREYRVLEALGTSAVPVPPVFAQCVDLKVNDAPFYVMKRIDGVMLKTNDAVRAVAPHDAARISAALVDTLVDLHAVDYDAIGLGDFGRPEGFLERNLARWGKQWETSKTRELPAIDELRTLLERALPTSGAPTIVHGDYRLDNTMLAPGDLGTIAAVLDWEMSTLGDPLTDVGLFLVYWSNPGHDLLEPSSAIDPAAGWFTREELAARYAERSGRDLSTLDFYVVFAQYKLAVILEGINARFQMGKTVGHGFDTMGPMVETLAESALDIARVSDLPGMH